MLDRHLEPDCEPKRPRYPDDIAIDIADDLERKIAIAEHNYECRVFNEPDKTIHGGKIYVRSSINR